MMGKKDGQMQMVIADLESLIPNSHLLKKIDSHIDFNFIYEKAAPYYSSIGRRSVDPVCMVKMLLVGYLFDTESGIVLGVDCYPANRRESDIILEHIKAIKDNTAEFKTDDQGAGKST